MPRPRSEFPTPGKRVRGDRWRVYWWQDGRSYEVSVGAIPEADAESARLEIALALRTGVWPDWAIEAGIPDRVTGAASGGDALIGAYAQALRAEVSLGWATASLGHLRELAAVSGKDLAEVSRSDASAFLVHVLSSPGTRRRADSDAAPRTRTVATRNRALWACSRFYRWALRDRRLRANPFEGIAALREPEIASIVHLNRKQRDAVLRASAGLDDGLAVHLALELGLRRGEIALADWAHVDLARQKLSVPLTKTRRPRTVPICARMARRLRRVPMRRRRGRLVAWPADLERWRWRARGLLADLAAACPGVEAGLLRWNVFRHTFASLLAQEGVSIYKIAMWLGNSVEVCRRHYAGLSPEHDTDIDRL